MIPRERFEKVTERFLALEAAMSDQDMAGSEEFVRMSQEYAELAPVVEAIRAYEGRLKEIADLRALLEDPQTDAEMRAMAEEELRALEAGLPEQEQRIRLLLLPRDSADEKNAILEIRAGTGGDEAALFAADLLAMYRRYAELRGWKFDLLESHQTDIGGIKEAVAEISGAGVFARLKFESGVHRVQRVPVTESGGRIHTSAATVAVLPVADDVDVSVDEKDLRIDTYRSQGAGGQHVNTTDSAVRITHLPTGIVAQCQDNKSQHKNKARAMQLLRAKLYEAQRAEQDAERAADRREQVGSGDRSERIRTYNFPQGRVTDHRINLTLYKLDRVLDGEALDELIEAIMAEDQARRLAREDD